jgi:hypothetical protein
VVAKLPLQANLQTLYLEFYKILVMFHEYRPRVGFKYIANPSNEETGEGYEEMLVDE